MVKQDGSRTYYTELPDDILVADKSMFLKNGLPNLWMPYLMETITGDMYHALRVGCYFSEFSQSDLFNIQLKRNKIYVFTNEDGSIRHK